MAKQPMLTVKINASQMRSFQARFTTLSNQIKNLQTSFNTMSTQITNTAKSTQALNNSLAGMLATSNRLHSSITGITHQFGRWATLIGSTVMMLGGGAGMFGLDRLLNSFIQRQRQALGIGSTFQETQAAAIAGQQFPGDAASQLANIKQARNDPSHPAYGLLRPGQKNILGFDPAGMTEAQVRRAMMTFGADWFSRQIPDTALGTARTIGFTSLMGEDFSRSLTSPEGRRAAQRQAALDKLLEEKLPKVTPEEEEKLDKLYQAWKIFTGTFTTDLTKMLAQLAPYLTKVSEAATAVLPNLVPKSGWDWAKMIGNAPFYLGEKVIETVLGHSIFDFKKDMDDLNTVLGGTISKLNTLLQSLGGGGDSTSSPISNFGQPPSVAPSVTPPVAPSVTPPVAPSVPAIPSSGSLVPPAMRGFVDSFAVPKPYGSGIATTKAGPSSAPWMSNPDYGSGAPRAPGLVPGPAGRSGSIGSRNRFVMQQAPGQGGLASMLAMNVSKHLTAPGGPLGRPAPNDMDNWQMGRTAQIHVHNEHPSIRMELAGLS